jgi:alkanesulfonate monooxygenase SsuD/methylene tetrahydromethanopterin reductase-like flavin-dependent oxidoreductase (luciferase family)
MPIEFGIFDHIERIPGVSLQQLYRDRLEFIQLAERGGFTGYHLAEHHGSHLCMAPQQAVFLAAVAQATERLRLGPLVFCLPLHHPLRLIEDICMLDNLSGGRLDVGIGRGVGFAEHFFFGHADTEARERFDEVLDIVVQGLTTGKIDSHNRKFHDFPEINLYMEPAQAPYPPLWYPGNLESAARRGLNFLFPFARITKQISELYRQIWTEHRHDPGRLNPHMAKPKIASTHMLCVAETDDEARRIGHRAWETLKHNIWSVHWYEPNLLPELPTAHYEFLQKAFGSGTQAEKTGSLVVGSPDTVREYFTQYAGEGNIDYLVTAFPFGDMTHEEAMRSLRLFIDEVMPAVRSVGNVSASVLETVTPSKDKGPVENVREAGQAMRPAVRPG